MPICTLSHTADRLEIAVTYDPDSRIYAIRLTHPDGWPAAAVFAIRFDGPAPLTISTDRHRIEGQTLSVTDTGFGNVLNGIALNREATALLGDRAVPFDLTGAAEPVAAFRRCPAVPSV